MDRASHRRPKLGVMVAGVTAALSRVAIAPITVLATVSFLGISLLGFAGSAATAAAQTAAQVSAQAAVPEEDLLTKPVNLSVSGSASDPVIGTGSDGAMHVLWWDAIDGERYARGTISGTQTLWTKPQPAPAILGDKIVNETTKKVTISRPGRLSMAAAGKGVAYATWFDVDDQLLLAQTQGLKWSTPVKLSQRALASAMSVDLTGTLRLAYIQSSSTAVSPSGVYYTQRGRGQVKPTLVYPSTYFRTADLGNVNISVGGDNKGNVLVVWQASREDQSKFAVSKDGGKKWSAPQDVVPIGAEFGLALQAAVGVAPNGEFILLWRDASAPGCGVTQRRSSDGGQTWTLPERVLTGLTRCPKTWTFASSADSVADRGKLWLLGTPSSDTPLSDTTGVLAAWDGTIWSDPVEIQSSYFDESTQRTRALGCLNFSLAGETLGLAGCDSRNDAWATRNQVGLNQLLPVGRSTWRPLVFLSRQPPVAAPDPAGGDGSDLKVNAVTGDVATAVDSHGTIYAVWTHAPSNSEPATSLALTARSADAERWPAPSDILRTSSYNPDAPSSLTSVKFSTPSLAVDREDRLHLVWSGGPTGRVLYSSAFARDAGLPSGWKSPTALPAPAEVGSSPDMLADPRGPTLYVIYAIPFNEKRGIYLIRSMDGGNTWLQPTVAFDATTAGWDALDSPRLALDARTDALHAVWLKTNLPGGTGPQAIYYARSTDGGQTWSEPLNVAQGAVSSPQIVILDEGQVGLIWNVTEDGLRSSTVLPSTSLRMAQGSQDRALLDGGLMDVWAQFSLDGGARWTRAEPVPGFENVSGSVAPITDGAGQLYLTALGQGSSGQVALLFSQWQGDKWGRVESTNLGQPAQLGNSATAVLLHDKGVLSVLLRLYESRPDGTGNFEAAAISRDIVPTKLTPIPTFTPEPTVRPLATATPAPVTTPKLQVDLTGVATLQTGSSSQTPYYLLLSGGIAALVIVVGSLIALRMVRRR